MDIVHLEDAGTMIPMAICMSQDKHLALTDDESLVTCQPCKLKAALIAVRFVFRSAKFKPPTLSEQEVNRLIS